MALNEVSLIGNLGADPEIRFTQAGRKVANFSLATTEKWTDKQTGEVKEKTEWHRVTVFAEGLAGVVEQYVKKGSKLFLRGKLRTRKWQGQDGKDNYTTEIVLEGFSAKLELLGDPKGNRPPEPPAHDDADLEDEIPF
ncbi:single-stranded DNA-binding protein [Thalassospiraceae bacterium SW-3-3]|nr:single-stranded DNA-binding protein [Thalassospiraceae bacterium SW-3-3]